MKRWLVFVLLVAGLHVTGVAARALDTEVMSVASMDGTPIRVECGGTGSTLLLVHGGTGDRSRWTALFPFFASHVTVCAMDRRGHGASGDSPNYSLQKEAEDVIAVINSRPGKVFVLGHSFGAVAALEAAFQTDRISKLVFYEPPVRNPDFPTCSILDLAVTVVCSAFSKSSAKAVGSTDTACFLSGT